MQNRYKEHRHPQTTHLRIRKIDYSVRGRESNVFYRGPYGSPSRSTRGLIASRVCVCVGGTVYRIHLLNTLSARSICIGIVHLGFLCTIIKKSKSIYVTDIRSLQFRSLYFYCRNVAILGRNAVRGLKLVNIINQLSREERVTVFVRERSGSVVECLTRDRGPHRCHCVVSLNIYPSLVLVQPRKTRPFLTERLLMGRKGSNKQTAFASRNR